MEKEKKVKKQFKFKWYYCIPIIFVLFCLCFAFYIYSSTKNDGPVYGRRCESVIEIDNEKIENAKNVVLEHPAVTAAEINIECMTFEVTMTFSDDVTIADAKAIANIKLQEIDQTLGYVKNSEEDQYSIIFSNNNGVRQYDVEFVLLSSQGGFPVFGTKQYSKTEVTYTDANAKNQELADELVSGLTTE